MKRTIYPLLLLGGAWLCSISAFSQSDITNLGGTITAQYNDSPTNEDIGKVIDNQSSTKYLTFQNSAWIQFQASTAYVVTRYSITSANDAAQRDPLNWTLQGSTNGTTWATLNTQSNQDFPNRFQRREFTFTNSTAYTYYRLQMTNNSGNILQVAEWELFSASVGCGTFPATWQEHWFEHNLNVTKVFNDCDVAIYYDNDMSSSVNWIQKYVGDAWRYTKNLYGDMSGGTGDGRLFGIFHANKFGGGHPGYYYDAGHDNRNVIDLGQNGSWANPTGWSLDATIHEIGNIVESTTHNAQGSPAFPIWGDSKWCVIYQYDVYVNVGWTSEATRWYNQQINDSWFRDWFYPIWRDRGNGQALKKFFQLLSQHFPKNGKRYSRNMNWGEFVHFWSGAAGVNLKSRATTAFGWPAAREAEFNKARIDFPFTYPDTAPVAQARSVSAWEEIAEVKDNAVAIWPNPAVGANTVTITVAGEKIESGKVVVYSLAGQKVSEISIKENAASLSMKEQPKGYYIAIVYYGNKVVKQRIRIE
jgi:hypothetical protein